MFIAYSVILNLAFAAQSVNPVTFPVFMKEGYSSILEFDEPPTKIVVGDQSLFQVEKIDKSIVLKPLVNYASTNMFVYFKNNGTRLFLLKASEDSEPLFYKKFEDFKAKILAPKISNKPFKLIKGLKLIKAQFDKKRDYLTLDFIVAADSKTKILPNWDLARLTFKNKYISPLKIWSERREVQVDSSIKARLVFSRPNIPSDLNNSQLILPIKGSIEPLKLEISKGLL